MPAAATCPSTEAQVRAIADRRTGVGCDQLIVIEPPKHARRRRLHAHPQPRWQRGRRLRQRHPLRRASADREETGSRPSGGRDHRRAALPPRRLPGGLVTRRHGTGRGSTGATSRWPRPSTRCTCAARRPGRWSRAGLRSAWATRTSSSSSTTSMRCRWNGSARCSSTTRCSPSAPISSFVQVLAPRPHPPARLGARRRHHPRLRHRRLRRAGRRRSPRPGRAAGDGGAGRRRA